MISEGRKQRLEHGYVLMTEEGVLLKEAAQFVGVTPERLFAYIAKKHKVYGIAMLLIAHLLVTHERLSRKGRRRRWSS